MCQLVWFHPSKKTSFPNITQSALKVMSTHHVHKICPTTKRLQFLFNFNEKLLNFLKLTPHGETQQLFSVFRMKKTHRPTSSFLSPSPCRACYQVASPMPRVRSLRVIDKNFMVMLRGCDSGDFTVRTACFRLHTSQGFQFHVPIKVWTISILHHTLWQVAH